jgi:hypothetical protein
MRVKKNSASMAKESKTIRLKTTLFDLFAGLIDGDINDAAVVASVRQIFTRYDVRLARTLTPLKLAASSKSVQRTNNHSKNALRWV